MKIVVFKMMDTREAEDTEQSTAERKLWDDTINLVLSGIGTLYSNYFDTFSQQTDFRNTWAVFIRYLEGLLTRRSFEVNTTVFKVLGSVLEKVGGPEKLDSGSKEEVWRMWSSQGVNLVENIIEGTRSGIQDTLTAFVDAFKPLYRLLEPTIDAQVIQNTLDIFHDCISYPDSPAYFQDTEILTPLQAAILNSMQIVRTDIPQVPTLMLKSLSHFSTIAYHADELPPPKNPKQVRPSYIALAVFSMKQMEHVSLSHAQLHSIYTGGALQEVLRSLKVPISLKYDFCPQNGGKKSFGLWRNATNHALAILRVTLPAMEKIEIQHQGPIWEQVADLVSSVVYVKSRRLGDLATAEADEAFDIDAFAKFRALIIPSLGRPVVPENAIIKYVLNVYSASLLYKVDADSRKLPANLDAMKLVGAGSTSELELQRRRKMSYVCIDELMNLSRIAVGGKYSTSRKVYWILFFSLY